MNFQEKIKDLREKNGLTLQEIADKVGVSKPTVLRWENGEIKNLKKDKIKSLATALNTTPAYLMGWEQENDELEEYLQYLRTRPEMKMLFNITKNASKKDVEKAVKIIEAMLE